ncbi:hypothetical protein Q5P01_015246 [Channa striata]|uniref:Uncharacterized protein n=1 Tax=Channa striata TaxID=64152 RepID=A0AA88MI49_CHASR|nr:hypothetical protein Q5P01_015246 [Channa striata]
MLNDASHGKKWHQACGRVVFCFRSVVPPAVQAPGVDPVEVGRSKVPPPPSLKRDAERCWQGDSTRLHPHQVGPGSIGSEGCPSAVLPADSQYVGGLSLTGSRRPADPSGQTGDLTWLSDSTYAPAELQHTYCAIIISYLAGASPSTAQI